MLAALRKASAAGSRQKKKKEEEPSDAAPPSPQRSSAPPHPHPHPPHAQGPSAASRDADADATARTNGRRQGEGLNGQDEATQGGAEVRRASSHTQPVSRSASAGGGSRSSSSSSSHGSHQGEMGFDDQVLLDLDRVGTRLFRPIPKKRRISPRGHGHGLDHSHPDVYAKVTQIPDSVSASSSIEAGNLTLSEDACPPQSYSTPATVSSDDDTKTSRAAVRLESPNAGKLPSNGAYRPATAEHEVEETCNEEADCEDEASLQEASRASTTPVHSDLPKPIKKHVDPGEGDGGTEAGSQSAVPQSGPAQTLTPAAETDIDGVLGERIALLSLGDVDNLVKGVATGRSLFAAAGLVAAVSALGFYDSAQAHANGPVDAAAQRTANTPPRPAVPRDRELQDLAKLAAWSSVPFGIDELTTALYSSSIFDKKDPKMVFSVLASINSAFSDTSNGQSGHTAEFGSTDLLDVYEESDESFEAFEPYDDQEADTFDANDKERWLHRSRKARLSSKGAGNPKKRKVPSTATLGGPSDEGVTSHKTSAQALGTANDLSSISLNQKASFAKGASMMAQAAAAAVNSPQLFIDKHSRRRGNPRTANRLRPKFPPRQQLSKLCPPLSSTASDSAEMCAPFDALPTLPLPEASNTAPAQTTRAAGKRRKGKGKPQPTPPPPDNQPVKLEAPTLTRDSFQLRSLGTRERPRTERRSPSTIGLDVDSKFPSAPHSAFTYSCLSRRFQADMHSFHVQKKYFLALLMVKRREELLQKKLELEEEKERLSRVLAADLASGTSSRSGKATRTAAASSHSALEEDARPGEYATPTPTTGMSSKTPLKKGKKKRSAYANANNSHHRQNYVPSRLPSSTPSRRQEGVEGALSLFGDSELPHDNKSAVFNFASDEWMCMFCEYELWYGNRPQLAGCVKKRKKLLKIRKKAADRAKEAVEGSRKQKKPPPPPPSAHHNAANKSASQTEEDAAYAADSNLHREGSAGELPPQDGGGAGHQLDAPSQHDGTGEYEYDGGSSAFSSAHGYAGVPFTQLLSYRNHAHNLPQPTYHFSPLRDPIASYLAISVSMGRDVIYRSTQEDSGVINSAEDAKEDMARRLLTAFITLESEDPRYDPHDVFRNEGISRIIPGKTDIVLDVDATAPMYLSNVDFLSDFCWLSGRDQPIFDVEETGEGLYNVRLWCGGNATHEVEGVGDPEEGKEMLALDTLKYWQSPSDPDSPASRAQAMPGYEAGAVDPSPEATSSPVPQ